MPEPRTVVEPRKGSVEALFREILLLALALALPFLGGCAAGVAGLVVGIVSISGGGGGGGKDNPPVVKELKASAPDSKDRILIEFQVTNEDRGQLGVDIQFVPLDRNLEPLGPAAAATPIPGSGSPDLGNIPNGVPVAFLWDAVGDLQGSARPVRVILTPSEDGKPGEQFPFGPFRAGNTPVRLRDLRLTSNQNLILVSFSIEDEDDFVFLGEGPDRVPVDDDHFRVEISVLGGDFYALPLGLLGRRDFNTAPAPGAQGSFSILVDQLASEPEVPAPLRALDEPGFVGQITVRVSARDSTDEEFSSDAAAFLFDNNNAPFVEILPFQAGDLKGGIVPVRYRVFDAERNPVNLDVRVDLLDGLGLRPAAEFPVFPSDGVSDLCEGVDSEDCILLPEDQGDQSRPFHTFLWDAISQPFSGDRVTFSIRADDLEPGVPSSQVLLGFNLAPFSPRRDVRTGQSPSVLASGDFDGDRILDLAVANRVSGTISQFRGGDGGILESRRTDLDSGDFPRALAAGDFDGDGFADLAVANSDSGVVSFFRGGADGLSADRKIDIGVGSSPADLQAGDFDGDQFLDLAAANAGSGTVTYLRGGADGLSPDRKLDLEVGSSPIELAAADFDGDRFLDLAAANQASGTVTWLGGGADGLSPDRRRDVEVGPSPIALAAGDFDGDGFPDLAAASSGANAVNILGGGGDGLSPDRRLDVEVGNLPVALQPGDFDGDGFLDLAVANQLSGTASYLRGSPGGLSASGEIRTGVSPIAMAAGDFDADGFLDLLSANSTSGTLTFVRGGSGGLRGEGKRELAAGALPISLAAEDFDADGFLDLAVTEQFADSVGYLAGDPGGLSQDRLASVGVAPVPVSLAAADFDGDRTLDLAAANLFSGLLSVLGGGPEGLSDARKREIPAGSFPIAVLTADFDGDGDADLASADSVAGTVTFFPGNRGGLSESEEEGRVDVPVGLSPVALAAADFDGDGFQDLVSANSGSNSISYIPGGSGGLDAGRALEIEVGEFPIVLAAGDFDGDGIPDLAAANLFSNTVSLLSGLAGEGLAASRRLDIPVGDFPAALAVADLDGDGLKDLAVLNQFSSSVSLLGGGPGGLAAERRLDVDVGSFPITLAAGDFDGDAFPDLAVANSGSNSVTLLRGGADGLSPDRRLDIEVGAFPRALVAADFDRDGFLDLAVANAGDAFADPPLPSTVSWLRGGRDGLSPRRRRSLLISGLASDLMALAAGDFDGDGSLDLAVSADNAGTVSLVTSRYLGVHATCHLEAGAPGDCLLEDPRRPARHRLELPGGALPRESQAAAVPAAAFEIPQGDAFARGRYRQAVTAAVLLLRAEGELQGEAVLTLRLLDLDPAILDEIRGAPERLRVLRQGPGEMSGAEINAAPALVEFDAAAGDLGVSFPVTRFGGYLVVLERDR